MLDHDDSPQLPLGPVRWALVWMSWAGVSVASAVSPRSLLIGALPAGLACLWVVAGSLNDLRSLRARNVALATPSRRCLRVLLVLVALASVAGGIGASIPSMGFRAKSGELLHTYGLSGLIAPIAFAAILGSAVRAFFTFDMRRIAVVGTISVSVWPFLVAIRVLREPFFDIDEQFVMLAPWAIWAYVASVAVVGGSAIALMLGLSGLAAAPPDQQPIPSAQIKRS